MQSFDAGPRFEIRRELGSGGMGVVYEAYDRERHELVALKTLHRTDPRWLTRFKREFRALHDISHPNLVSFNELFEGVSAPFFTMELLRGVDFLTYVRGTASEWKSSSEVDTVAERRVAPADADGEPQAPGVPRPVEPVAFDEARLRNGLKQLAIGIATLHAVGKIHRDIKPSNIIVTGEDRVVLLDFGLLSDTVADSDSTEGGVLGTVAYMAPEQAVSGEVSAAADWYSAGVVLFESLTGALPHNGRTQFEMVMRKQKYPAAPPRQFVSSVPADLDALCSDLLQAEPSDRPPQGEIFDRLGIEEGYEHRPHTTSSSSRPSHARFVGRDRELDALRRAYERDPANPRIALIEGISGVGKSQLVERFLTQLPQTEPNTLVLSGRCYEREVVTYKALDGIVEQLSSFLRHLPPVDVAQVMPLRAGLLARLFPVLRRVEQIAMAPTQEDMPDPHDQRQRMFGALRELFSRIARRRRLVWYIDDLQWTDADSMVLLHELIAYADELPVFLVATMRPVRDRNRVDIVARLNEMAPVEHIKLADLAIDEARELAELLLPASDTTTLDAIARESGGHPLFLHELARHASTGSGHATLGVSLDDLLDARLEQLNSNARHLLRFICVAGGPLAQEVAAVAAGVSQAELRNAAKVLRAANLARTDGVGKSDRIVVYHDRVREHVTESLDAATLRHAHKRLAVALEQTGAAEYAPRALVRHARAAGRDSLAAKYAETAAAYAVSSHAFDLAADMYGVAIELGSYDQERLRELRLALATALVNAGRGPEAAQMFLLAANGADPAVRLDCQRRAADQLLITGHIDEGMEALRSSLADIDEPLAATPRRALLHVLWNRARLRVRGLGFRPRQESQVPAEQLRRLEVLKAVAHGLAMVDNIRGADFNGRFLLAALRTGVPGRLVQAMATEVIYLCSQGGAAARRGRRVYSQLVELVDESSNPLHSRCWMLLADGGAAYCEGRFERAAEALAECEILLREHTTGMTFLRNNTRVLRVHSLRVLGALTENGELIADAIRSGRQRGDRYLETTLQFVRGTALLAHNRVDEARATLENATWSPPGTGYHMQHWSELRTRVEIALYTEAAAEAMEQLAPEFVKLDKSMLLRVQVIHAEALSVRGRLLLAADTSRDGAASRREVAALARRLERLDVRCAPTYAALLRVGLSARRPDGDDQRTVTALRRALDVAADSGMRLHLAAARHYLGARLKGNEGKTLRQAAAAYAEQERIARPEQMYRLVLPGFDDS